MRLPESCGLNESSYLVESVELVELVEVSFNFIGIQPKF